MELSVSFAHGLGDCANFAHILELYRRRGYRIRIHSADDKIAIFDAVGVSRVPADDPDLAFAEYPEPGDPSADSAHLYWLSNKAGINLAGGPLPNIGPAEDLWKELLDIRLDAPCLLSEGTRAAVDGFLRDLPRPIVLVHSMGNTFQRLKNLREQTAIELYRELLDRMDGTLVLLDWDDRVPRLASGRVRHMTDDWTRADVPTLIALLAASDLLVSVDSGPLHLARMTDIPVVGVFPTLRQHPARVSLPRGRTVNVVPRDVAHPINLTTRILYNVVEGPGSEPEAKAIAETAARMLAGPRYLTREHLGADVQLQQFVLEWERGEPNALSEFNDRHRGFDLLLKEVRSRFLDPVIVETGCIRSEEDWRGAGYSTYLLGAFTQRWGGHVVSVDNDQEHCNFARRATSEMKTVEIIHEDSVSFLAGFGRPIDVLLLDSMDTENPGQPAHALAECRAASPRLHDQSLIVIDDTVRKGGTFFGSGSLAVPWLIEQGWRVLHSGYQTILVR